MEARNAAGRRVSLLNDDTTTTTTSSSSTTGFETAQNYFHHQHQHQQQQHAPSFQASTASATHSRPHPSPLSSASSPITPELLRSDSYDSQISNDPISPLTPSVDYVYSRGALYGSELPPKRPAYIDSSRSTSYEDDAAIVAATAAGLASDRPGKRYPCRYRDTHGCEKTFTTSGHASRHSKIHTAEKAVHCTYDGCSKKFTRADNMKQHLETHFKDKSRSSASQRAHKAALAEARRSSAAVRSRASASRTVSAEAGRDARHWESDAYAAAPSRPMQSPIPSSWDMRTSNLPILNRPTPMRASGLDALAMAVACQEGGARR